MDNSIILLSITAISIGFIHTILGPDHYLPFIVLSQAKNWTMRKTMIITFICGIGHVLSSVILGLIGIAIGISVTKLVKVETFRGNIAAWLFIAFGLVYMIISLRNLMRKKKHSHPHFHFGGEQHLHEHDHHHEHSHIHENEAFKTTPWILFLIFIFGPCEPLIPLVMYPAAQNNVWLTIAVTTLFSVVTISTMLVLVLLAIKGINFIPLKKIERYNHAIAGLAITLCGVGMVFFGL